MTNLRTIEFGSGRHAVLTEIREVDEIAPALAALEISPGRSVLVLVGGASNMEADARARATHVMRDAVVPVCEATGSAVVDGGTTAGVMQLMGDERATSSATFPLIGVAAVGTVQVPGDATATGERAALDPHHTHFLLVPGASWGDESPWIVRVARALADGAPVVGLVMGGGDITVIDVQTLADAGAAIVAVAGTGGVADRLATAPRDASAPAATKVVAWDALRELRASLYRELAP